MEHGAKTFGWSKDVEALVHDPVSDSLKPTLRQKGTSYSHKSNVSSRRLCERGFD